MTHLADINDEPELQRVLSLLSGPISPEILDIVEELMLEMPGQIDTEILHNFCGELYVREATLRPGIFLGHSHKEPHHCVVLSGRMIVFSESGPPRTVTGPVTFTGAPGRKLAIVLEPVTMQNIHPTTGWDKSLFKDVDAMEEHLYAITPRARSHRRKELSA